MNYRRPTAAVQVEPERDFALKVSDEVVIAAVGDLVPAKPLTQRRDQGLHEVIELLTSADATFGNMEAVLRPEHTEFDGHNLWEGPFLTQAPPACAEDLRAFGFNLLSFCSNRTHDWGIEGQRFTLDQLRTAGLNVAGSGENLAEARAATYFESPGGTVALVTATNSLTRLGVNGIAGEVRGKSTGRPGLSPLRSTVVVQLPDHLYDQFRAMVFEHPYLFPPAFSVQRTIRDISPDRFAVDGRVYQRSQQASLSHEMDQRDLAELMQSIRNAKLRANVVVASLHHHQFPLDDGSGREPLPVMLQAYARECVSNGADLVCIHGPGHNRGVEIIDGKPVLYGLGNFIRNPYVQGVVPMETYRRPGFTAGDLDREPLDPDDLSTTDNETATLLMPPHPREYFETVIARIHFTPSGLKQVALHPVDLGFDEPIADIGIPRPASPEVGARILARIAADNRLYGTKMRIEDGVGIIEPEAQ